MEDTIVLYPALCMGHLTSILELAKLILRCNFHKFSTVHVLLTTGIRDLNPTSLDEISNANPSIIFHSLPLIQVDFAPTRSSIATAFSFMRLNGPNVRHALQEISEVASVRAFVIDFFGTSAMTYTDDLGIPTYYFFTSGLSALPMFLYFPTLHNLVHQSCKGLFSTEINIPGLPPFPAALMPQPVLDRDDPAYYDILSFCEHLPKSKGIVVNTFDELQPTVLKAIRKGLCVPHGPTPQIYNIGPLVGRQSENKSMDSNQTDCLSWLDRQPKRSVVYLCSGRMGTFSADQIKEIANGLEISCQRFLWVVKNPPVDSKFRLVLGSSNEFEVGSLMPEGFLERTKDKGLVITTWAPQWEIIKHDAVGRFVTHCGWNSTLEAVIEGIPMLAWPLNAEQHINGVVLVGDMKLALGMERSQDGFVNGEEVGKKISDMMDSERGKELRERNLKMKDLALASQGSSGSSTEAFVKLVNSWLGL